MPIHICPKCTTKYKTSYRSYKIAKKAKDDDGIEQFLSGICSDKCWTDCSHDEIVAYKYINPRYAASCKKVIFVP